MKNSNKTWKQTFIEVEAMHKEQIYEKLMRAIMLIEDGAPHMAKRILEELANKVTFIK